MNPGREMDALVAVGVMGRTDLEPGCPKCGELAPRYSTDIAAAEQVAEELRRRGYVVQAEWHPRARGFARVALKGGPMVDRPTEYWPATGESVAAAICLAALKALGVKLSP